MSDVPSRVEPNISTVPSQERDARLSPAALLMPLPSWTAAPHGASTDERLAVQMSVSCEPVLVESHTISRPS